MTWGKIRQRGVSRQRSERSCGTSMCCRIYGAPGSLDRIFFQVSWLGLYLYLGNWDAWSLYRSAKSRSKRYPLSGTLSEPEGCKTTIFGLPPSSLAWVYEAYAVLSLWDQDYTSSWAFGLSLWTNHTHRATQLFVPMFPNVYLSNVVTLVLFGCVESCVSISNNNVRNKTPSEPHLGGQWLKVDLTLLVLPRETRAGR